MEPQLLVNGQQRALGPVGGQVTLLEWLRGSGFTGSKEGCAEGECGACAVLVAKPDVEGSRWTAINSCLVLAAGLDGQEVVTAEGLGRPGELHPVQAEMAARGGSQCGYCTPGFIASMAAEYYRPDRVADEVDDPEHGPNGFDLHALSGNLCRCTGYRPIRDAAYALEGPAAADPLFARTAHSAPPARPGVIIGEQGTFVRPSDLSAALGLLAENPDARVVAGSTDWGVELNIRHARVPLTIGIDRLPELREFRAGSDVIEVGAALTLSEIERLLAGRVPLLDELFPQFASRLIRNGATLGGNLGTGSPIGDSPPVLLALDASLVLVGPGGEREVALAEYFTGYRQSIRAPQELIKAIRIPLPIAGRSGFYKIAKRRFDDISSVAVAFALRLDGDLVSDIKIGLGGAAATPVRARATEQALIGGPWAASAVEAAAAVLCGEGTPLSDHRASADYRRAMLGATLRKFQASWP